MSQLIESLTALREHDSEKAVGLAPSRRGPGSAPSPGRASARASLPGLTEASVQTLASSPVGSVPLSRLVVQI